MDRIEAGLLIPGDGAPVIDGVLVADGAVITYAGPAAGAPATPAADVTTATVVMPGLWDCHGHFMGARSLDLNRLPQEPTQLRAARSATRPGKRAGRRRHVGARGGRARRPPGHRRQRGHT